MSKLATLAAVKGAMLAKIADSLLDNADATKLKFKPLTAAQTKELDVPVNVPGFLIPYFSLDGKVSKFWRLRYLEDTRKGFDVLNGRKALRYVQASGGVNEVYLPPFVDWREIASNATIPLVITEGELKAACTTKLKIPTIGLGGVYCFKSTKNKESMLPMLRQFVWKDRDVMICYDSDAVTNPMVVMAENQLATLLTENGALVSIIRLPSGKDNAKVGLDDFMQTHDAGTLMDLLASGEPFKASQALHEMNELVAYIRNPGLIYDYQNNMRLSCSDFTRHAYSNYWYTESIQTSNGEKQNKVPTATAWLQWAHRTELEAVTFAPGQDKIFDRKLNLWNGWEVEPAKGDVKPWQQLLDHLFQGTDPEARKWFEQWCAYPLQNPGAKMASAAVFWGKVQGSGKTMVGHTLMKIYGKYSAEITDTEIEDDRFDWAENMQFVLADDITANNNRKLANRLKTMITQKTLKVNPKYIPRYNVPDCINYYFTSNDPDAFYLDDGDRRYFIHEVRSEKINTEFRNRFIAWRNSQEGVSALFHYLLGLDLSNFDPQAEAYVTHAKEDMIQLTKSDLGTWVHDLRSENSGKLKLKGDLFTASELLALYDPMGTTKVTANGMARELKRAGYRAPGRSGSMAVTVYGNVRLYAVRNVQDWADASMKRVVEHYESSRSMDPSKVAKKPPKF